MSHAPVLYAITDNGVVTTDVHRTVAEALTRLDTLNARYPNHGHSLVPLHLHPAVMPVACASASTTPAQDSAA